MKNVADIYALTPLQQLMLGQALARRDAGAFVEQFQCTLSGRLQPDRLRAAAEKVIELHPLLRACFAWEGLKQPVQVVRQHVTLGWIEHDWRGEPADSLTGRIADFMNADRQAGFLLNQAPLTRFHLIRTGAERWLLVWTCHHLLIDGWSAAVVLKEFFESYERLGSDAIGGLGPVGSFADYLSWLRAQDANESEQFWRNSLRDTQCRAPLPVEVTGHAQSTTDGASGKCERRISAEITSQLNQLAARYRVGLSTVLQAAWALLLARYSSQQEVIFGIAVSGRPPRVPRVESIVGPLMNNIPLRAEIDWGAPLSTLLASLQSMQSESQPHEHCPLEQITRAAGWPVDRRMFESLLVFENYPLGASGRWRLGELEIANLHGTVSSNYPLTLIAIPHQQLQLRLLYDTQRFSAAAAQRLLARLENLLAEMTANPSAALGDYEMLDEDEFKAIANAARLLPDRVLDAAGHCAPVGVPGEVWTTLPVSTTSPLSAGELPEPRLDPFDANQQVKLQRTGYRGVWNTDGSIEWLGRSASPARIDNYGADPAELTTILALHTLVAACAIVARPDSRGLEHLAAFVVPAAGAATILDPTQHGLLFEQLQRFLADRVPGQLVPRIWRTLESLPRKPEGGLDEERLPAAFRPRGQSAQAYVAPRDSLEEQLCTIWSEVLGVEPVGIEDDFLDLGGYSSLAVTMATRLEAAFGRQWSLASLLEKPTIAQLATLMRQRPATSEATPLVPIRASGSGTPLFCIHPAGGTVLCYRELARQLDAEIPVYGLQAQGIDDDRRPLETIEAMAASYLQAIQSMQPHGPYQLCGWSTGGVIAFEVARQLAANGETTSLVALLDAAIPRAGETFGEGDLASLLGMLLPGDNIAHLQALSAEEQLQAFSERAQRANLLGTGSSSRQANRIYQVFQANMQAVAQYACGAFDQPLTIIRAAQQATPMHTDPYLGWGSWVQGNIEVREVAGSHLEMLQPPIVGEVANILTELMSQVAT